MKYLFIALFASFIISKLYSQNINKGSNIIVEQKAIFGYPDEFTSNWEVLLVNKEASDHVYSIDKKSIEEKKSELAKRRNEEYNKKEDGIRDGLSPKMNINFEANLQGGNVPPDNSMAVSHNGHIVSAINSNIIFANGSGQVLFRQNLSDFYTLLEPSSSVYDPRIIYDIEKRRFIVMALHGNTPSSTKLYFAFSKTEDPSAGWYYYGVVGNPLKDDRWFDYPNVGLTKKELFIGGLMRDNDGLWKYTIVFQIDKNKCFEGENIRYKYYTDITNVDGTAGFNLVPTHSAWSSYPDKKMHFISNIAQGGDKYYLHTIDGSLDDNPSMTAQMAIGLKTELAPDGLQKTGPNVLNTFDSRIWNAMELNGVVHFGGHVNSPANTSGLLYGRYDIKNNEVNATLYFDPKFDYGFPSIAAFDNDSLSDKVLIHFLKTGRTLFASQGAILFEGKDNVFNHGKEKTIKTGNGVIDALSINRERWGDYSTVSRRFYGDQSEVWAVGCHAKGTSYGNWIAQFLADSTITYVDFYADKTTIKPGDQITFKISSPAQYKSVSWNLSGSNTNTSTAASPTVSYSNLGSYDVIIKLIDNNGKEYEIKKKDYINVRTPAVAPIAEFSADKDTIFQGELVQFTDKSKNNPVVYNWTFLNGIPNSSKEKNPLIQYNKVGSHLVSLTVKNEAGNNNVLKQKFITVKTVPKPIANFSVSKQNIALNDIVNFMDLSLNVPTSWTWEFEGGTPATSTEKNPSVQYKSQGVFSVSLKVKNINGESIETKSNYIMVGQTNIHEDNTLFKSIKLLPNPVLKGDKIIVEFFINRTTPIIYEIYDSNGRLIKTLLNQKTKFGDNEFSFNTENLSSGVYFLKLSSGKEIKSIPFVIN